MSEESALDVAGLLERMLEEASLEPLSQDTLARFVAYHALFVRWNQRTNLSAVRDQEEIVRRHFVESIFCAQQLPIELRTVLDFGSGGGFPGIPIALCRPEITVCLAESQGKKAAFLQEAVRVLALSASVHAGRAEDLGVQFDCVTLRAVDRMENAVAAAARLVDTGGILALMTTEAEADRLEGAAGSAFSWEQKFQLPGGSARILALGLNSIA
jgi:16S rRNA (guanine527-N7)-methyltransferase